MGSLVIESLVVGLHSNQSNPVPHITKEDKIMFPFFICITTVILDFHNPLNYTASFSEKTTTHPLILSLICNPINYTCNPIIINTKQTLQTYVKTYKILLHNISMVLSIYWTHLCHNLKIIVIHSILLYY